MTRLSRLKVLLSVQREFVIQYDAIVNGNRRKFQGRFTLDGNQHADHMYVGIRDITDTVKNEGRSLEMSDLHRHTAMLGFPPVGKRFVLLIESGPAEQSRLSAILFRQYHVLHAVDEDAALSILQTEYRSISLIFYSCSGQLSKGSSLLRTLQQDHLLHTIPVFVLSDNADP